MSFVPDFSYTCTGVIIVLPLVVELRGASGREEMDTAFIDNDCVTVEFHVKDFVLC